MSEAGDKISRRVMARTQGINRSQMADGGSVVSGPTVSRALRAVGARAFTWDQEIYVGDDFDASNPEDQALYAHERFHQMQSGGMDHGHGLHDAEEAGAQAIERMVLHRAAAGEDLGSVMRDATNGAPRSESETRSIVPGESANEGKGDAIIAYEKLLAQGIPYDVIVRDLTKYCLEQLHKTRETSSNRRSKHEYL